MNEKKTFYYRKIESILWKCREGQRKKNREKINYEIRRDRKIVNEIFLLFISLHFLCVIFIFYIFKIMCKQ